MRAALAVTPGLESRLFSESALAELRSVVDLAPSVIADVTASHSDIELLITGWGAPTLDATSLSLLPNLRHIVHAGGSVKQVVDPVVWERGISVTSAAAANARPVAEFALAMIILASKNAFTIERAFGARRVAVDHTHDPSILGSAGVEIGILGASATGRALMRLLRPFDFRVLVTDPTISPDEALALGAELVPIEELFSRSRIVSLHAPLLPQTAGAITAALLGRMPEGATLINTARGKLVDTRALTAELLSGRLNAILDVTDPEPLPPDHPLWALPNVVLTPHLAGSQGSELQRLGAAALQEVHAILAGRPPLHPVLARDLAHSA